jgi:exodeoxyribonuclease VII large subunit
MENKFSLLELNEYIRQVLILNFSEAVWVSCEISQVNQSRGHFWMDLVEKDLLTDVVSAKSSAVLWRKDYLRLQMELGTSLDSILQDGMQVLLKVKINYHEAYGMKFIVEEIDPGYTLGQLEIKRQETILKLRKKGLFQLNSRLELPAVIQRIAVLSSETAAGLQDYLVQIKNNKYGYHFENQLFTTVMQGQFVEKEMRSRLKSIERRKDEFDAVVIIRGGGARLDLSAFDAYELCKTIAEFPLPVLTGIGHDVDETVADMVAHTALKTPTAVADFILNHNANFEGEMQYLAQYVQQQTERELKSQEMQLQQVEQTLRFAAKQYFRNQEMTLAQLEKDIPTQVKFRLFAAEQQLKSMEKSVDLLSPEAAFRRGFTITTKDKEVVRSKKKLAKGDKIETYFEDGSVESEVK